MIIEKGENRKGADKQFWSISTSLLKCLHFEGNRQPFYFVSTHWFSTAVVLGQNCGLCDNSGNKLWCWVGPDVYPEVKIISTVQPDMICFVFFLLKQWHVMTSREREKRTLLAHLLTHSAALLHILQTGIMQRNLEKPLLHSVSWRQMRIWIEGLS